MYNVFMYMFGWVSGMVFLNLIDFGYRMYINFLTIKFDFYM